MHAEVRGDVAEVSVAGGEGALDEVADESYDIVVGGALGVQVTGDVFPDLGVVGGPATVQVRVTNQHSGVIAVELHMAAEEASVGVRVRWLGVGDGDLKRAEAVAHEEPKDPERDTKAELEDLGQRRHSWHEYLERVPGVFSFGFVESDAQRRTVVAQVLGDAVERFTACGGVAGDQGDRAEDLDVLPVRESQREVRTAEFRRRGLDDTRHGLEWDVCVGAAKERGVKMRPGEGP